MCLSGVFVVKHDQDMTASFSWKHGGTLQCRYCLQLVKPHTVQHVFEHRLRYVPLMISHADLWALAANVAIKVIGSENVPRWCRLGRVKFVYSVVLWPLATSRRSLGLLNNIASEHQIIARAPASKSQGHGRSLGHNKIWALGCRALRF